MSFTQWTNLAPLSMPPKYYIFSQVERESRII